MNLTDILTELIARGVRADVIVEISAKFADADAAEKIRAQTRNRVRNHRERVTLRNDTVTLPPPVIYPPNKKKDPLDLSMRAKQLPHDFTLTEADRNFAGQRGWDGDRIKSEFEHFCDHATAKGRKLADWHAGWRTWVQSPYNSGKANGNGRPHRKTTGDVIEELRANLRAKMAGTDDAGRGTDGGPPNDGGLFGVLPVQARVPDDDSGNVVPISDGGSDRGLFARPRRS